jgi:hypothetical protein
MWEVASRGTHETSTEVADRRPLDGGAPLAVSGLDMLRIGKRLSGDRGATITLEGRLVGPWVDELVRVVEEEPDRGRVTIDLRGLAFADGGGVSLLRTLREAGVKLFGWSGFVEALIGTEHQDRGGRDVG